MMKMLLASSMFALIAACSAAAQSSPAAYTAPLEAEAMSVVDVAEAMQEAPTALQADLAGPPVSYASPASYAPSMSCDIDARRTSNGIRLVAYATSDEAAYGEYELVFTKHDAGGSSNIMQGGEFDISRGHQELGTIETSLERGGRYSARLTVYDANGVACETDLRR